MCAATPLASPCEPLYFWSVISGPRFVKCCGMTDTVVEVGGVGSSDGGGKSGGEAERDGGNCITITVLLFSDKINVYIYSIYVSVT